MPKHIAIAFSFIKDPRFDTAISQGISPTDMSRATLTTPALHDPYLSPLKNGDKIPDLTFLPDINEKIYVLAYNSEESLQQQMQGTISIARAYHLKVNENDSNRAAMSELKPFVMIVEYEAQHVAWQQEPDFLNQMLSLPNPEKAFIFPIKPEAINNISSMVINRSSLSLLSYPKVVVAVNVATHGSDRSPLVRPELVQGHVHNKAFFVSKLAGESKFYLNHTVQIMRLLANTNRYVGKHLSFCPIREDTTTAQNVVSFAMSPDTLQRELIDTTVNLSEVAMKSSIDFHIFMHNKKFLPVVENEETAFKKFFHARQAQRYLLEEKKEVSELKHLTDDKTDSRSGSDLSFTPHFGYAAYHQADASPREKRKRFDDTSQDQHEFRQIFRRRIKASV